MHSAVVRRAAVVGTRLPPRALVVLLAILSAALWVFAVVFVVQGTPADQAVQRGLLELLVVGIPLIAALYALRVPRTARFGYLLLGSAVAWSLTALGESVQSVPYSVGRVSAWLVFPLLIYLMLSFPEGRLASQRDSALFGAANALIALFYVGSALFVEAYPHDTPWATCRSDCPANAFLVLDAEPAVMGQVIQPLRELLAAVVLLGVTASMVRRWRAATPLRRITLGPVVVAGSALCVALIAFFAVRRAWPDSTGATTLGLVWSLSVPAVAAAFLVGLQRRRLLLAHTVAGVAESLRHEPDPERTRDEISRTLRDSTLEVFAADAGGWRDSGGRFHALLPADERALTLIPDWREPEIALAYDVELREDEELVEAVGMLVLAGLHHQRLLSQLDDSRRRLATAAGLERARIERDLHDGAQQRLITLRINLTLAEELMRTDPEHGLDAVHELGAEIEQALEDVRSVAHGIYPALLAERGVGDALRGVAMQTPMPVDVEVTGLTRLAPEIETAVYFTCLEALQNALKHAAGATGVWIVLRQGRDLTLEVRDDGPGFEPGDSEGGLRNMRDRLEAIGGRLSIVSSPGHGTRVLGRVPLT
jgi:signal transduction histidine kinase